jgi:diadenosine tetraphosphate (Ap4A) HIT family hydrolase
MTHVLDVAHKIGGALKVSHSCVRVGLIIAGYEINHCHVHVIPPDSMDDLDFKNAAASISRDELEKNAALIRSAMSAVGLTPSE